MKAIVVLFEGNYMSVSHREIVIKSIANVMSQRMQINLDNLKIIDFEDVDIAKLLVSKAETTNNEKQDLEELTTIFCDNIITKVGNPVNFSNESLFKVEFVKRFLNDADIRQQNTDMIKYLISAGRLQPTCKKVLEAKHLSNIPYYLREINGMLKLF
jgi:hypothetical protein